MFIEFNFLLLFVWVFFTTLLPGSILGMAVLKKEEKLNTIEKAIIGAIIGFILLPQIPFLLNLIFGIKFDYTIAIISVLGLYAIAAVAAIKTQMIEEIKKIQVNEIIEKIKKPNYTTLALTALLIVNFLIRSTNYSPIFSELDPYYYNYVAYQILSLGHNPINDGTAWYPDLSVSHREISQISYLESIWYSIYTGGESNISNYLLVLISSIYPVLAALFMVFSIYLLVSVATRREFGLVAAGVASFLPIVVLKLSAGEIESQPYAFFAMTFTLAMIAYAAKERKTIFSLLAGLGIIATFLGSSVGSLVATMAGIFFLIYPISIFLSKEENQGELTSIAKTAGVLFVCAFIANIIRGFLQTNQIEIGLGTHLLLLAGAGLSFGLSRMQKIKIEKDTKYLGVAVAIVFALIVFLLLPQTFPLKEIGKSQFQIATYNAPLDRTIAEQRLAGDSFGDSMGFFAEKYDKIVETVFLPIKMIVPQSSSIIEQIGGILSNIIGVVFLLFSIISNILVKIALLIVEILLGTKVSFTDKANSLLLFWIFAFAVTAAYSIYEILVKKKESMVLLFLSALAFPLLVGLVKDKYSIYAGVLMACAVGFTLGTIYQIAEEKLKEEKLREKIKKAILYISIALVFFQFMYNGFAVGLLIGSVSPIYQNDPSALTAKFSSMCQETGGNDPEVCAAARDPVGFAEQGLEYQYNPKLCALSAFSSYNNAVNQDKAPFWERVSASFRCQRLSPYWISSMEWIKTNTPEDARIISWWDYGHWINYFGQRGSVLRNDHKSNRMIGEVADAYLDATPQELIAYMKSKSSQYALFDMELVASGNTLGGKYGALNYLSCAHNNETTVALSPGESKCEADHLWESIIITNNKCTISKTANQSGLIGYKITIPKNSTDSITSPEYPYYCNKVTDQQIANYCKELIKPEPIYCVGDALMASGETITGVYDLNNKDQNGDLKLIKAQIGTPVEIENSYHFGKATQVTLYYTNEPVWFENGNITSGISDAKNKFYKSNLYRALFLNDLPGFTRVYTSPNGEVKIYKINN